jgi:hypothetical protein
MLRFLFWTLLIINAMLLALNLGHLGDWSKEVHEPHRMNAEKNTTRMKLMSASAAQDVIDAAVKNAEPALACLELGNFTAAESKTFEDKIKPLALGARQSRIDVSEIATNMVYLASQGSKDAADKKAAQLRKLGITEFYIVQDQSPLRWGISLGVFKTPEAAKAHLANLTKKGVKDAKIAARQVSAAKFAYRLQDMNAEEKKSFDQIKEQFSAQEIRECKSKTDAG